MAFTTFIFGNGLGRAIDPYFELRRGIKDVWKESGDWELSKDVKKSIINCLSEDGGVKPTIPSSEDQLITLHEVTNLCRRLRELEPDDPKWLTEKFRKLPEAIDEFIAKVSFHFHRFDSSLLPTEYFDFVNGLSQFIRKQPSHLATLNYDNLLYLPLIENSILDGYNGHLIDGFHSSGFNSKNLVRVGRNRKKLGWYLHLHGSPLFYLDAQGRTKKYSQTFLENSFNLPTPRKRHVVLCHTKDKPQVIADSRLLQSYWRYFSKALKQSNVIYIFGYGGADEHLNKEISSWIELQIEQENDFFVKIVEWKDPLVTLVDRKKFWAEKFSTEEFTASKDDIKIKRLENILQFDWNQEIEGL